jgi:hypothetical protein
MNWENWRKHSPPPGSTFPKAIPSATILQRRPIAYEGEARQCPHCYSIYLPFVEGCGFAYPQQSQCDACPCGEGAKPTDRVWIVVRGKRYGAVRAVDPLNLDEAGPPDRD